MNATGRIFAACLTRRVRSTLSNQLPLGANLRFFLRIPDASAFRLIGKVEVDAALVLLAGARMCDLVDFRRRSKSFSRDFTSWQILQVPQLLARLLWTDGN